MPSVCWAQHCPSKYVPKSYPNTGCRFYGFPNERSRRALWILKCGRLEEPNPSARLCQFHFEYDSFERKIAWKLKPNAIPTIFFGHSPAMEKDYIELRIKIDKGAVTNPSCLIGSPKDSALNSKCVVMLKKLPIDVLEDQGKKRPISEVSDSKVEVTKKTLPTIAPAPTIAPPLVNLVAPASDSPLTKPAAPVSKSPDVGRPVADPPPSNISKSVGEPQTKKYFVITTPGQSLTKDLQVGQLHATPAQLQSILLKQTREDNQPPKPAGNGAGNVSKTIKQAPSEGKVTLLNLHIWRPTKQTSVIIKFSNLSLQKRQYLSRDTVFGISVGDEPVNLEAMDDSSLPRNDHTYYNPSCRKEDWIDVIPPPPPRPTTQPPHSIAPKPVLTVKRSEPNIPDTKCSLLLDATRKKLLDAELKVNHYKSKLSLEVRQHNRLKKKIENLEQSVSKVLEPDQVAALSRRSTQGGRWGDRTMFKALILWFSFGARRYDMISDLLGVPLPSTKSMQRFLEKASTKFIDEVFGRMARYKIKSSICRDDKPATCPIPIEEANNENTANNNPESSIDETSSLNMSVQTLETDTTATTTTVPTNTTATTATETLTTTTIQSSEFKIPSSLNSTATPSSHVSEASRNHTEEFSVTSSTLSQSNSKNTPLPFTAVHTGNLQESTSSVQVTVLKKKRNRKDFNISTTLRRRLVKTAEGYRTELVKVGPKPKKTRRIRRPKQEPKKAHPEAKEGSKLKSEKTKVIKPKKVNMKVVRASTQFSYPRQSTNNLVSDAISSPSIAQPAAFVDVVDGQSTIFSVVSSSSSASLVNTEPVNAMQISTNTDSLRIGAGSTSVIGSSDNNVIVIDAAVQSEVDASVSALLSLR